MSGLRDSLRRVAVISLWETRRTGMTFNKKTLALLLALGVAMALLGPVLTDRGLDFDRGLYRVGVNENSPLLPAILGAPVFRVTETDDPLTALREGRADIAVVNDRIYFDGNEKSSAAVAALKQAAKDYTFVTLLREPDQDAAFPVRVELVYAPQDRPNAPVALTPGAGSRDRPDGSPDGTGGGTTGTTSGGGSGAPMPESASGGDFSLLPPERSINTPETLSPPFPFRSLILAYLFLIPLNFVVQIYAGSAIGERLARKGEALLASPARPWEIIVGKALPYFALMMLVCALITVKIGGSWLSLLAVAPLALAFLALEFIAAMFARSFRELTFLTVFSSVLLTIYAFLPAVFTDVHPVALVSPISLVILDLRGTAVSWVEILYSVLPLTLFSLVLFVLGAALYREEDLFHQKPVLAKAVDSLARQIKGLASGFKMQVLLLPIVLICELLLVAFLFAWPANVGVVGVLLAVATVEEVFKGAPSYAAMQRGKIPVKRALLFGALTGVGFFVAEKGFLVASLAGMFEVPAGAAVLGAAGGGLTGTSAPLLVAAALIMAPLLLHVVTASITSFGASMGRRAFAGAFVLAVAVHTLYNLLVVRMFGGLN